MGKRNKKRISRNLFHKYLIVLGGLFVCLVFATFLANGCTRNLVVSPTHAPFTPTMTSTPTSTKTPTPSITPTPTNTPTTTPFVLFEDFENASTGPWAWQNQNTTTYWGFFANNSTPGTTIIYNYDSTNISPIDPPGGWSMGQSITYMQNSDWVYFYFFSQYGAPAAFGTTLNCLLNGATTPGHLSFWVKSTILTECFISMADGNGTNSSESNAVWITPGPWSNVVLPLTNPPWDANISNINFSNISGFSFYIQGPVTAASYPLNGYVNFDDFYFTP